MWLSQGVPPFSETTRWNRTSDEDQLLKLQGSDCWKQVMTNDGQVSHDGRLVKHSSSLKGWAPRFGVVALTTRASSWQVWRRFPGAAVLEIWRSWALLALKRTKTWESPVNLVRDHGFSSHQLMINQREPTSELLGNVRGHPAAKR